MSIANNTVIHVWVQGEKIGGQWLFDDGTPIPEYCRFSMSNGLKEVHMRAFGSSSFACGDNSHSSPFNYSCEYRSHPSKTDFETWILPISSSMIMTKRHAFFCYLFFVKFSSDRRVPAITCFNMMTS